MPITGARLIASGLGAGFAPRAPGTVGSVVALLPGVALLLASPWLLGLGVIAATLAGFWAIPRAGGDHDPGWVVIDEVAGQWLCLLGLAAAAGPPGWPGVLAALLLFRLFDITKPGPIGWADRRGGAFGVMADDLLAGAAGAILLGIAAAWFPALIR